MQYLPLEVEFSHRGFCAGGRHFLMSVPVTFSLRDNIVLKYNLEPLLLFAIYGIGARLDACFYSRPFLWEWR